MRRVPIPCDFALGQMLPCSLSLSTGAERLPIPSVGDCLPRKSSSVRRRCGATGKLMDSSEARRRTKSDALSFHRWRGSAVTAVTAVCPRTAWASGLADSVEGGEKKRKSAAKKKSRMGETDGRCRKEKPSMPLVAPRTEKKASGALCGRPLAIVPSSPLQAKGKVFEYYSSPSAPD